MVSEMNRWCSLALFVFSVGLLAPVFGCVELRNTPASTFADSGAGDSAALDAIGTPNCPLNMVPIPAATFSMGSQIGETNERPVHQVELTGFCIDPIEVTVSAYSMCPAESGCTAPSTGMRYNWGISGRENHPINGVDWNQAMAYCQWRGGGTLPTEAQWEFAAKGLSGRIYPWGIDEPLDRVCWSGGAIVRTSTCFWRDVSLLGTSPFGLSDMGGNVWEWVFDGMGLYPTETAPPIRNPTGPVGVTDHVLRGGSWGSMSSNFLRTTTRAWFPAEHRSEYLGFRCAHAPQ